MAYSRKLSKRDLAKRHLAHCENEVRKSPNNKYYIDQVAKTKKLLGYDS